LFVEYFVEECIRDKSFFGFGSKSAIFKGSELIGIDYGKWKKNHTVVEKYFHNSIINDDQENRFQNL